MEKMGFLISHKNNEQRRALLPEDLECIRHRDHLVFETGYGDSIGFSDKDYHAAGASIGTREQVLACGILVDVKLGDADYLDQLQDNKLMIGWAHAVQKMDFTSSMLKGKHTVLAWEEIFEDGRYIFYRNREVAGEAAVLHAYRYCGKMPYDTKVAIIGNGQTAKGAMRILHGLGAQVDVYGRRLESLFKKNPSLHSVELFRFKVPVCLISISKTKRFWILKDQIQQYINLFQLVRRWIERECVQIKVSLNLTAVKAAVGI